MSPLTVDELLTKIHYLSVTSSLELAKDDSLIFGRFCCHPVVPENSGEGMWGVVNKAMDYAYGLDVSPEDVINNLKGGKYGLECVFTYLDKARKHSTWQDAHDGLLSIKLERMIDGFRSESHGVLCFSLTYLASVSSNIKLAKSTKKSTKADQKVERGLKHLLKECPRASSHLPCKRCAIKEDENSKKTILTCHCGRQVSLPGGRTQNAKAHWETDFCKNSVKLLKEQPPINLFFNKRKPEDEPTPEERELKRLAWTTRCVGLNDQSWPR
ncbi:hypothetical protein DFH28DRAFT_883027, partial [Melampsora americana]